MTEIPQAARDAVRVLNEALVADPSAMYWLIRYRVQCNEALAEHPSIQVGAYQGPSGFSVGWLGIVNGLFGTWPDGWGFVAAVMESEPRPHIVRFELTCSPEERAAKATAGESAGHATGVHEP